MMRQWLASAMALNEYYMVDTTADADTTVAVFQLLALETKPILVTTHEGEVAEAGLFEVSVQPLEIWSKSVLDAPVDEMEAFVLSDPCLTDVLDLPGDFLMDRSRWHRMEPALSDLEGCIHMRRREQLSVPLRLLDPKVPILTLLDALADAGFTAHIGKVHHTPDVAKYDDRHRMRSRSYFQCLLSFPELASAGVTGFPSGLAQSFYSLLLKTKKLPVVSLPAKEHRRQLALLDGDAVSLASLDRLHAPAAKRLCTVQVPLIAPIAEKEEDCSVAGDESLGGHSCSLQ